MKLDENLTGPPLGFVNEFRETDWLVEFTKYPYLMIEYGDTIANDLWLKWRPTIKAGYINDFYGYSFTIYPQIKDEKDDKVDEDIRKIYAWITEESKRQGIHKEEMEKRYGISYENMDSERYSSIINLISNSKTIHGLRIIEDAYKDETVKRLEIIPDEYLLDKNTVSFSLLLPDKSLAIPFVKCGNKYILLGSQGRNKIHFPRDESYYIYGYNEQYSYLKKHEKYEPRIKVRKSDFTLNYDEIMKFEF